MNCSNCRIHKRRLKIAKEDLRRHIEKYQKDESNDLWVEYSALHVRESAHAESTQSSRPLMALNWDFLNISLIHHPQTDILNLIN
jgi:hypothetical protein